MSVPSRLEGVTQNDLELLVTGLWDGVAQAYLNASTVSATLYDSAGNAVTGFTNVGLSYIGGSNGNYRGMVPESFNPTIGTEYTLKLDANEGSSYLHMEIPTTVKVRRS